MGGATETLSDPILQIEGLTKRYGQRVAVDNLSLNVNCGDIYGFLGHNGAGKSTTIRMIMGMVWPTSGAIRVNGHLINTGRHKHHWPVGAIIESPIFYDHLSGRTNLEILASLSGGAEASRIDEVVKTVGLTERQNDKVSVYSHGMRQRLGVAQALLPNPELIILDEPLDGLDPRGIRDMRDVMTNAVRNHGVTLFISSHILSEVEMTCNRVAVIHQGKKLFEGTTKELISVSNRVLLRISNGRSPADLLGRLPYVEAFKSTDDPTRWMLNLDHAKIPDLNRELVKAEIDVLELTPHRNRLEDVFLSLTEGGNSPENPA